MHAIVAPIGEIGKELRGEIASTGTIQAIREKFMIINGRGMDDSIPYERLKALLTQEGCLLEDEIEVRVDRKKSAERIKVLAALIGYETALKEASEGWILKVDTRKRRCR